MSGADEGVSEFIWQGWAVGVHLTTKGSSLPDSLSRLTARSHHSVNYELDLSL